MDALLRIDRHPVVRLAPRVVPVVVLTWAGQGSQVVMNSWARRGGGLRRLVRRIEWNDGAPSNGAVSSSIERNTSGRISVDQAETAEPQSCPTIIATLRYPSA